MALLWMKMAILINMKRKPEITLICECNIVKMAVQISEKTFYYSNK